MSTGIAKNLGAVALVILALVVAVLVFGSSPATVSTAPVAASYSPTPTLAPYVIQTGPAIECPPGARSTAPPGPIPTVVSTGYRWEPARNLSTGWCEVAG